LLLFGKARATYVPAFGAVNVAVPVRTDQSTYAAGASIRVAYAGMPGYPDDWIAIAPAGSADTSYLAYVLTNGQTSGTTTFTAPSAGTYVARAFPANTFARLAESPPFSTTGGTSRSP